jgi:hypothetical protein
LSPDEQEARSLRWGGGAVHVLPLSSGRFALFVAAREHWRLEIVDEIDPKHIRELSLEGKEAYRNNRAAEKVKTTASLEELGLL